MMQDCPSESTIGATTGWCDVILGTASLSVLLSVNLNNISQLHRT